MRAMNRRTFLKRGLLGGVLLAAGGGAVAALTPSRVLYEPRAALKSLTPAQFNVLAAIAARIVIADGADPVAIAHSVDHSLSRMEPELQKDLADVFGLFESPLAGLLDFRLQPFTRLSPEAQDAALLAWRDSAISLRRGAYRAIKNLCTTAFYRQESAWALAGYPGPPDSLRITATTTPTEDTP